MINLVSLLLQVSNKTTVKTLAGLGSALDCLFLLVLVGNKEQDKE